MQGRLGGISQHFTVIVLCHKIQTQEIKNSSSRSTDKESGGQSERIVVQSTNAVIDSV